MKVHRKVRSEWCRKLDFEETNQSKGMRQENFSQKKNQNVKMTKRSTICLEQKHSTVKTTCRRSPVLCQNDHPFFSKSSQFLAFNYLVLTCSRSAVNAKMTFPSKKNYSSGVQLSCVRLLAKITFKMTTKRRRRRRSPRRTSAIGQCLPSGSNGGGCSNFVCCTSWLRSNFKLIWGNINLFCVDLWRAQ